VVVDGAVYLVDCGEGWGPQIRRAGLSATGYHRGLESLVGVFFTHLHSDHTVDYPNLLTLAWHNGGDLLTAPIDIYGPGDRMVLPPIHGDPGRDLPVVAPHNPTPGLVSMTQSLIEGFATDLNDRIRDYHKRDLAEMFRVHDIALPPGAGDDPNGRPAPLMDPFVVHEDSRVQVTATLVNHAPVFPAFAFRFDTDAGSITFSGDTCPCDNLVRLAQGSDVLVHEVIDREWAEGTFATRGSSGEALLHHLLAAHTTIEDVGAIAQEASVSMLALHHLIPGNNAEARWAEAAAGFDGPLVVGQDLMEIRL
jgi:ribonuclease BN (tRNA processing enzyme)